MQSLEETKKFDYESTYQTIKLFVARPTVENMPKLFTAIFSHLRYTSYGYFTVEQKSKFMDKYLPEIMKAIVDYSYKKGSLPILLIYMKLFVSFLSFNIHNLTLFTEGVSKILQALFKQTKRFYLACSEQIKGEVWNKIFEEMKKDADLNPVTSTLRWGKKESDALTESAYTFLVLCIERSMGFVEITKVLKMAEAKDKHLMFVGRILRVIIYIKELNIKDYASAIESNTRFAFEYAKKLLKTLQYQSTNNTSQIKASSIGKLIRELSKLATPENSTQKELISQIETHYQQALLLAFKSVNMESRKSALNELACVIKHLKNKWPTGKKEETEDAIKLVEILNKEKIFDFLYRTSNISGDTIKMATEKEVLNFMYAWKIIQKDEIETIWLVIMQKSGEKYIQGILISALKNIVQHFNKNHAHNLFTYIKQVELSKFSNENYIEIIEALAINEYNRNYKRKACKIYILDDEGSTDQEYIEEKGISSNLPILNYIFFYLLSDEALANKLPDSIQKKLANKFISLLVVYYAKIPADYREYFFNRAKDFICKDTNPRIMGLIFFELFKNIFFPTGSCIKYYDPFMIYSVLEKSIGNFYKMKEQVKSTTKKLLFTEVDSACANPFTKRTYKNEMLSRIEIIINLIYFLGMQNFKSQLLDPLFKNILKNNISKYEKDIGYRLLYYIIVGFTKEKLMWDDAFENMCKNYLMNLDPNEINLYCFMTLEKYIQHINIYSKKSIIKIKLIKNIHTTEIKKWDIYGFDKLWDIMCFSTDENAKKLSFDFFLDIYTSIESDLIKKSGKSIIKETLKKSVNYLKKGIVKYTSDPTVGESCINQTFDLLFDLKKNIEDFFKINEGKHKKRNLPSFPIKLRVCTGNLQNRSYVTVNSSNTLKELIETILTHFNIPKKDFSKKTCIRNEKIIVSTDEITVYEIGICFYDIVSVMDNDYEMSLKKYNKTNNVLPSDLNIWKNSILYLHQSYPGYREEVYFAALRKAEGNLDNALALFLVKEYYLFIFTEATYVEKFNKIRAFYDNSILISNLLSEMEERDFITILESMKLINAELFWKYFDDPTSPIKKSIEMIVVSEFQYSQEKWEEYFNLKSPFICLYALKMLYAQISKQNELFITSLSKSGLFGYIARLIGEADLESLIVLKAEKGEKNLEFYIEAVNNMLCLMNTYLQSGVSGINFIECLQNHFGEKISKRKPINIGNSINEIVVKQIAEVSASCLKTIYKNIIAIVSKSEAFTNESEKIMFNVSQMLIELFLIVGALISLNKHDPKYYDDPTLWGIFPQLLIKSRKNKTNNVFLQEDLYFFIMFVNELHNMIGQKIKINQYVPSLKDFISALPKPTEKCLFSELYFDSFCWCLLHTCKSYKESQRASIPINFIGSIINAIQSRRGSMCKITKDEILYGYFRILCESINEIFQKCGAIPSELLSPETTKELLLILTYELRLAGVLPLNLALGSKDETQKNNLVVLPISSLNDHLLPLILNSFTINALFNESQKIQLIKALFDFTSQIAAKLPEDLKPAKVHLPEDLKPAKAQLPEELKSAKVQLPEELKPAKAQLPLNSQKKTKTLALPINSSASLYCGLENFSATCYVNALLQQLFLMPVLRDSLLKLPYDRLPSVNCYKVLRNLKTIFTSLNNPSSLGQNYYSPIEFCCDFKGFEGKPIEHAVQHDVDEFFILLIEQMEKEFMNVPGKSALIKSLFGIQLNNKIESAEEGVEYNSEKIEDHYKLMLDIKNKNSIEEALDSMIEGELMENENGVEITELGRKIRAKKSCKIKLLNNMCVIHLKRIEFNMETQKRKKINDYCSFPNLIDFSKWMERENSTTESSKKQNEFALVGIILHSGVAESGHYASIIKERNKQHPNYGKWYKFNDTKVKEIAEAKIKKKSFGNEFTELLRKTKEKTEDDEIKDDDENKEDDEKLATLYDMKPSAYMLIYERIENQGPEKSKKNVEEEEEENVEKFTQAEISQEWYCSEKFMECIMGIGTIYLKDQSPGLLEVNKWTPKTEFVLTKEISTKGRIEKFESESIGSILGQAILQYITEIQSRNPKSDIIIKSSQIIDSSGAPLPLAILSNGNTYLCLCYLEYLLNPRGKHLLFSILIKNNNPEIRECFSNMILLTLQTILMSEQSYLLDYNGDYISLGIRFILMLFYEGLPIAQKNFSTSNHYFITLKNAIGNISHDAAPLISGKAITILIDFLAKKEPSLVDNSAKSKIENQSLSFVPALQFLCTILRCCSSKGMKALKNSPDYSLFPLEDLVNAPEDELMLWFNGSKWNYLDLLNESQKDLYIILVILTWGDEIRTKLMMDSIGKELVVKKGSLASYQKLLWLAKELICNSGDNYNELRLASLFFSEISALKSSLLNYIKAEMGGENDKWAIDIFDLIAGIYQNGNEDMKQSVKKYLQSEIKLWINGELKRCKSKFFTGEYGVKVKKVSETLIIPLLNDYKE